MDIYAPTNELFYNTDVYFNSQEDSDVVYLEQYDNKFPVLAATMFTGNMNPTLYTIPEGADANIRFRRPDGHVVYNSALGKNRKGNVIYFEITQTMTMIPGDGIGVIEIVDGEKVACTGRVSFRIKANPIQEDSIEADDDFKVLTEYVEEVKNICEEAIEKMEPLVVRTDVVDDVGTLDYSIGYIFDAYIKGQPIVFNVLLYGEGNDIYVHDFSISRFDNGDSYSYSLTMQFLECEASDGVISSVMMYVLTLLSASYDDTGDVLITSLPIG